MLNFAVVASLLTALVVELRHHRLVVDSERAPWRVADRRTQFLLETWALTGISLAALALSQAPLH